MKRFIQISDCHIDDTPLALGVNTHHNLMRIVAKITSMPSDALFISGDLTHNGTLASYQKLKQILAPIKSDIFVISGNHDDKSNLKTFFAKNLFNEIYLGDWAIISMDSVQIGKTSGYLPKKTLGELDRQLRYAKARYIFLMLHHPVVPMQSTWNDALSLENPKELFSLVKKHPRIRVISFGHAHESAQFVSDNIKIIACPSTAIQFNHEKRIGFNDYVLHNNGVFECKTQWIDFPDRI